MKVLFCACLFVLQLTAISYSQLITPEVVFVPTNGSFTLNCPGAVQWLKADINSLQAISNQVEDLTISGFHRSEHAGDYYCVANTSSGVSVSCPTVVKHAYIEAGAFQVAPSDTIVHANETVVLECSPPYSQPAAVITWQRNGEDLNLNNSRLSILPNGNLYILNAQLSDAGDYRCIAENPVTLARRHSTAASLIVNSTQMSPAPPSISVTPATISGSVGDSVLIECRSNGYPATSDLFWEKLYAPIFPANARVLRAGALLIGSLELDNAGTYRCIARNDLGRVSQDVEIRVIGPPDFAAEPDRAVSLDEAVRLSWTVLATGSLKVLFFHDGEQLDSIESHEQVTFTTLVQPESHGLYQVIAQSEHGCSRSSVVMATPSSVAMTTTDPSVVTTTEFPEESITVFPNMPVELKGEVLLVCIASQFSSIPEVVWLSPSGEQLSDTVRSDQAHIVRATVPGVYSCRAQWEDIVQILVVTVIPVPLAIFIGEDVTADIGEPVDLVCEAEGTAVDFEWFYGPESLGSGDVSTDNDRVVSRYSLPAVSKEDAGVYTCRVSSAYSDDRLQAGVRLTVNVVLGPPVDIFTLPVRGGVHVFWHPPQDSEGLLGYKLNWGAVGDDIRQVTRLSKTNNNHFFSTGIFETYGDPFNVLLWGYTLDTEGEAVLLTLALERKPEVHTCQVVYGSHGNATVILRPHTAPELTATCSQAQVNTTIQLPADADSAQISELLPDCNYTFEATNQDGEMVKCGFETPEEQVDLSANVTRFPNGSVSLHWVLPTSLRSQPGLLIEVNWGAGWVGVASGEHLPVSLEPNQEYDVQLRFSLNDWSGVANVTIPMVPTEDHSSRSIQIAILYGAICGGVLLVCCLVLLVILSLKLVQYRRREESKTSDKKEKDRAIFRRMSMERVSRNSMKRPVAARQNNSTDV